MAAGLGFKTFTTGEVLTAANVNGYLMQGVLVFASAAARDAAITSPQEGQFAFTKDNDSLWYYSGSAWVASGATGDIEGITAGTGISGGGTSGTVTITNSMATAIDAKGDLIVGTGADTFSRLAVGGTDGQVLTVASGESTGLQWAAPASSGGMTLLSTTTLSGASTTISSIPSGYINLFLQIGNYDTSGSSGYVEFVCNADTSLAHYWTVSSTTGLVVANGSPIRPAGSNAVQGTTNGSYWLQISDYANTSNFKSFFCAGMMETTSASSNAGFAIGGIRTNSAITSIDVKVTAGTQTGTARLYGVK